jgi:amidase
MQTNCLSEINFESALTQAVALDAAFAESGSVGALHGLPVSLKDNFNVEGLDTTLGFVAWANDPVTAEKESILVKQLKDLGAIILCKTYVQLTDKADEQECADCNDDA